MTNDRPRSSRRRHLRFVDDYKHHRLEERPNRVRDAKKRAEAANAEGSAKWRQYIRDYLRWLRYRVSQRTQEMGSVWRSELDASR